jgi:hypothetical protein
MALSDYCGRINDTWLVDLTHLSYKYILKSSNMNTNQTTENNSMDSSHRLFNPEEMLNADKPGSADKKIDNLIIHEVNIVTPHPYGVFALCKIFEHFQIN